MNKGYRIIGEVLILGLIPIILFGSTLSIPVVEDNASSNAETKEITLNDRPLVGKLYIYTIGNRFTSYQGVIYGNFTFHNIDTGLDYVSKWVVDASNSYVSDAYSSGVIQLPAGRYSMTLYGGFALNYKVSSRGWLAYSLPFEGAQEFVDVFHYIIIIVSVIFILAGLYYAKLKYFS